MKTGLPWASWRGSLNSRLYLENPDPTQENHVVPPSSKDEALAHYSVSREVPCSVLKCETFFHRADHIPPHIHCPVSLFYQVYWIPWRFNPGMSVLLTLYSHIWLTLYKGHFFSLEDPLSLLPDYLLNIFQISIKTTSSKQPFMTLTQLRSPCFVDIGHSVLFPLDTCPSCGATFNFEIHLISVFSVKI